MRIFINPGHCPGADPGACGNGLSEADVVLKIGKRVENYLNSAGIETKVFQFDGLEEISYQANEWGADLFVSIHCNAANGVAKGTETFCCRGVGTGRDLASAVHGKITSLIPELVDRGVKEAGYYVLVHTDMPAILVETAFIDNPSDAQLLVNREDDFAKAIAQGLCEYAGIAFASENNQATKVTPKVNEKMDISVVASLSAKYESNGDPACIADNAGDLGGISYGKYQFASNVGAVKPFVDWLCDYPDSALANYGRVLSAYEINSEAFINQWIELGTVDPVNFGKLQDEYMVNVYYGGAAKKLAAENFHLEKHSDALKAVVFSRAVQNGQTGCKDLFVIACQKLGQPNLSYVDDVYFDEKIISAIYDYLVVECDMAVPDNNGIWRSPDNFVHGGKNIILALRSRFIREKQDALNLLK